eukprot:7368153-Heterocapsa_arctica.AAC.1
MSSSNSGHDFPPSLIRLASAASKVPAGAKVLPLMSGVGHGWLPAARTVPSQHASHVFPRVALTAL